MNPLNNLCEAKTNWERLLSQCLTASSITLPERKTFAGSFFSGGFVAVLFVLAFATVLALAFGTVTALAFGRGLTSADVTGSSDSPIVCQTFCLRDFFALSASATATASETSSPFRQRFLAPADGTGSFDSSSAWEIPLPPPFPPTF